MSNSTLKSNYVTDTMAIVLYLEQRRSSQLVRRIFESAQRAELSIHVPAIVLAEILYLSEKGRITASPTDMNQLFSTNAAFKEAHLTSGVVAAAAQITDVPELHDRLIAGTARFLGLSLITNDPRIQTSRFLTTVW